LRTLAALTAAKVANCSEETVATLVRTNSARILWYTGNRTTVASGIRRADG
jgi:hypothetical protein